ncbi:hypothetical protein O6H91_22G023800 [Diphasiastrum complanatum]|uniref:Uncharacterized protein n=1 Tax=Diphasiastrum complanatum TaxID=34168 RepID=A0ACC2ADR5_DIPCM|nr:hypothetical protein O6H91_22G023800 [Diphasiastrum complanatum]
MASTYPPFLSSRPLLRLASSSPLSSLMSSISRSNPSFQSFQTVAGLQHHKHLPFVSHNYVAFVELFGKELCLLQQQQPRFLFELLLGKATRSGVHRCLCAASRRMATAEREKVGAGQESVWDYPRPPRLEPVAERIRIVFNSLTIADTTKAYRVLETSHPPVYYIPPADINLSFLKKAGGSSFCEWKGNATYWTLSVNGKTAEKVGWSYENPTAGFLAIKGYIAFYAGPMDVCFVGDEKVEPQPGGFYGGWITSRVVGPFKGVPGSWGW